MGLEPLILMQKLRLNKASQLKFCWIAHSFEEHP